MAGLIETDNRNFTRIQLQFQSNWRLESIEYCPLPVPVSDANETSGVFFFSIEEIVAIERLMQMTTTVKKKCASFLGVAIYPWFMYGTSIMRLCVLSQHSLFFSLALSSSPSQFVSQFGIRCVVLAVHKQRRSAAMHFPMIANQQMCRTAQNASSQAA